MLTIHEKAAEEEEVTMNSMLEEIAWEGARRMLPKPSVSSLA